MEGPFTPPKLVETAVDAAKTSLLPDKSKEIYITTYQKFMEWRQKKNTTSFSENVLLAYFKELALKVKPTTLWAVYSMLKSTLIINNNINIRNYYKLITFLKKTSVGFKSKKAKVFTAQEVEKFLNEAPDHLYLAVKVSLIFGITGGCGSGEMCKVTVKDVQEFDNSLLMVKLPKTTKSVKRSFTITGTYYQIVKKYMALRPHNCRLNRFFLKFYDGKCSQQPIGKHKFASMPRNIAAYLGLADPEGYTGRSFRRTADTRYKSNNVEGNVQDNIAVAQSSITTVNPSAASGAMPRLFLSTNQTLLTHNTIPQYQTLNLQGTTPAAHLNRVNIIRFVSDQSVGNEVSETEFDCTDFNNWHKYDSQERARLVDRYYKWLTGSSVDEIKKAKNVSNILGFQKLLPKVADHPLLMKRLLCPKNDNDGMFSLLTFMLYMKPPLLKLYNSREKKVRLKLLESVMDHLQIFTDEEVKTLILPEIKLGLQDVDKTIVRATLLCLANLVETLGPQVVIGGASKEWFVNSEDLAEEHEVEIKTEHLDSTNESEFEMEAIVKIEQIDVEEEHINYSNENVSIDINPIKTENDVIKKESNRKKKKPRKSLRRKKVIHYEESESETEDSSFSMDESDEVIESEDETEKKDKKKRSIKKAEDDEETASDEAIVSEDEIERKDKRKRTISNNKDSKEADTEDSDEAIESEDETKREDKRKRKRRKKKDEENKEAPIFIQLVA